MTELATDLAVRFHGRARNEAPTLVFLHGLTDSGSGWPGAVEHWGKDFAIITFDARGHGESPRFTPEQREGHPGDVMVEDAISILDQLGENPVLIGHSLGGAVALATAVRRPDLVRALVLEDPAPLGPGDEQRDPARGAEFVKSLQASRDAADDEELLGVRKQAHPDWADDELLASGRAEQQMDVDFLALGDYKPSAEWPDLFKELMVPALVVTGDGDEGICIDNDIERGIADIGNGNVSLVRIKGAGHCVRREQPAAFYEAVDAFLTTH